MMEIIEAQDRLDQSVINLEVAVYLLKLLVYPPGHDVTNVPESLVDEAVDQVHQLLFRRAGEIARSADAYMDLMEQLLRLPQTMKSIRQSAI